MRALHQAWPGLALLVLLLLTLPQGFSAAARQPQTPPAAPAAAPAAVPGNTPRGNFYVLTFIDVLGQYQPQADVLCRQYIAASRSDAGGVRFQALAQTDGRENHIMLFGEWKSGKTSKLTRRWLTPKSFARSCCLTWARPSMSATATRFLQIEIGNSTSACRRRAPLPA